MYYLQLQKVVICMVVPCIWVAQHMKNNAKAQFYGKKEKSDQEPYPPYIFKAIDIQNRIKANFI